MPLPGPADAGVAPRPVSEPVQDLPLAEIHRLVAEEQALLDLAMLVATAGPSDDVLTAICRATGEQLDGQEVTILEFESADVVVAVATHGGPIPSGVRAVHAPGSLPDLVAA